MKVFNIFDTPDTRSEGEVFEDIIVNDKFILERIISSGESTPAGEWLAGERDEWVMLVSGSAELLFEGISGNVKMRPGDHLYIPAGKKHRVEKTWEAGRTVWVALRF
ncbi:MAG: cupin [Candidatus Omnitrophota bacterium]